MKLIRIYSLLLITILLVSSCIRDNLDDCGMDVELYFEYPDFPERIHKVNVGIMNENGRLLRVKEVGKGSLLEFQGIKTRLNPGRYIAVCWGNTFEETRIRGLSYDASCYKMCLDHPNCKTEKPICTNDSLFYGKHSFTIPKYEKYGVYKDTILYQPAHITFEFYVFGLESTALGNPSSGYPYISINNLKAEYNYEMKIQGDSLTYLPSMYVSSKNKLAYTKTHVLRFTNDNPIEIVVSEAVPTHQDIPYTLNLKEFLKDHLVIEEKEEYIIRIGFYFGPTGTQVRLLGWIGVDVDGEDIFGG